MYKPNPERLSKIKRLRELGYTIDRIAATTGDPRSTVGYYVKRYCGGRERAQKHLGEPAVEPGSPKVIYVARPESEVDRVEAYLRGIEGKDRLSIDEVLQGKKRKEDRLMEEIILHMFEKDPEALHIRLKVLSELIRFAPFLRINIDGMRDMLGALLTEELNE